MVDRRMAENDVEIILPESDEILICAKCKTTNPIVSNFCLNCGTRLRTHTPNTTRWVWLIILIFLFAGVIYYFHHQISRLEPRLKIPKIPQAVGPVISEEKAKDLVQNASSKKDEAISSSSQKINISVAMVVIKDITGKVINEIPTAVLNGGWVAIPKRLCLGGAEWALRVKSDRELAIVEGLYSDYDKIGLWRVEDSQSIEGPQLYPWAVEETLSWLAFKSNNSPDPVILGSPSEQGYFIEGKLPKDFNDIGVLFQQHRFVGWTFGNLVEGAFVWNGEEGRYLQPDTRVEDFYRITFADGREEEFTLALAMTGDYSNLERLEAFANGFRLDPKLSAKETPEHLQVGPIIDYMQSLVARAAQAGLDREVAGIFDTQILVEASDIALLMEVARATAAGYGYEDAIDLTEEVVGGMSRLNEKETALIKKFYSSLYQQWIAYLFKNESLQGAWRAFRLGSRKLPNDLDIHLMGVQLALAENNWTEAERLLDMKDYPLALKDKIQNLKTQISELKGQEGKIVIRFAPGTRKIPVGAVLNSEVNQTFIVDTGASLVTIPRSTAEALGLAIDGNPMRKILTAGGVKYAPEVNLYSITIDGREVYNVKALVLDIAEQPELGLLGLNYLERFRMDMNTEEGLLLLEPR